MSKYINLRLSKSSVDFESNEPLNIQVKFDDDGVVIDVWDGDDCIESAWGTYSELGINNPIKRKRRKQYVRHPG